jgi:hypothetical protein
MRLHILTEYVGPDERSATAIELAAMNWSGYGIRYQNSYWESCGINPKKGLAQKGPWFRDSDVNSTVGTVTGSRMVIWFRPVSVSRNMPPHKNSMGISQTALWLRLSSSPMSAFAAQLPFAGHPCRSEDGRQLP